MKKNATIKVEIYIRPRYNTYDDELLLNPFEGKLLDTYFKEAIKKISPLLADGSAKGKVDLTTLKGAVSTIYLHSKDLELEAYYKVEKQ